MKIDRKLNIVHTIVESVTVRGADGKDETKDVPIAYVHSEPISTQVFEAHFLILSKTLLRLYDEGIQVADSAARVSLLMLRQLAAEMAPGTSEHVEKGLLPEIWRLTNVLMPDTVKGKGWEMIPFDEVIQRKLLSEEDIKEVQNRLCFFTAASHYHNKEELTKAIWPMLRVSGAQIISSTCMEFLTSLPISTTTGNTGVKAPQSSIPT